MGSAVPRSATTRTTALPVKCDKRLKEHVYARMAQRLHTSSAVDAFLRDLRYGVRGLLRTRWLTLTAITIIGLGGGVNATVFSFVDALLYRPPAGIASPDPLVEVFTSDFSSGAYGGTSGPDYLSLVSNATSFSVLAAHDTATTVVSVGDRTERINTEVVTRNFFDVLGTHPALGRFFAAKNDADSVVIGHQLWTRAFGGRADVLGATIAFGGRTYTVVGVAPERFEGLDLATIRELWTVLPAFSLDPAERGNRGLAVIGRLAPGVELKQAEAELDTIADHLARTYPATNRGTLERPDGPRAFTVARYTRIGAESRSQVAAIAAVILTASLLVLVIACANVGNLLLVRASARDREIAIRLAMGAGHRQILRHLVIESLVLGLVGGVAGLLFALWTADVLPMFFPPDQVRLLDARVDFRVLVWCLTICTLTTMMFGIAPVVRSWRPAAATVLRREGLNATESRGGARLRRAFVVVQVALAFVLLAGAGLLAQSLRNALDADLGFGAREGIVVSIDLPPEFDAVRSRAFYQEALARVQSLPDIERAALSSVAPLTRASRRPFQPDGYQQRAGEDLELFVNAISPSYFEAMQIPLTGGRLFDDRDTGESRRVVIVNDEFASRYFGGAAVGRLVRDPRNNALEIVGTVRASAMVDPQSPRTPVVYFPLAQEFQRNLRLVASTRIESARVLSSVVSELKAINGAAAVFRPTTIQGQIDEALAGNRLMASLVGACGVLALALATVGLYGVVAFSVAMRTREIGIRIALGASTQQLSTLVLREGLGLTMLGAIAGGAMAPVVTTAIGSMLYGVSPLDPQTFLAVPVVLCLTALVAASVPLRRALHIDPIRVLRQE